MNGDETRTLLLEDIYDNNEALTKALVITSSGFQAVEFRSLTAGEPPAGTTVMWRGPKNNWIDFYPNGCPQDSQCITMFKGRPEIVDNFVAAYENNFRRALPEEYLNMIRQASLQRATP